MSELRRRPLQHSATRCAFAVLGGVALTDAGGVFTAPPASAGVGALLDALPAGVARVYLIGARPSVEWLLALDSPRWSPAARGHFLAADRPRVGRYAGPGAAVEVRECAEWFGAGEYTPADALAAWALLAAAMPAAFGDGATLLGSPAGTGQYALTRSLPFAHTFPAPDIELAALIRSTTTQGRIELCPSERVRRARQLPAFAYLDGRMMYAALTRELPCAVLAHDNGQGDARAYGARVKTGSGAGVVPYARARYRVNVTVPAGWAHVGLLLTKDDAGGWRAPAAPGETFETWCDGAEADIAVNNGWRLEVRERILFETGKPLETWTTKLLALRAHVGAARDATPKARALAAVAVRAMLLHTIGTFAQTGSDVTRVAARAQDAPADKPAMLHGAAWVWTERAEVSGSWRAYQQPQWSSAIWGRCRARLLSAPGATGALSLARDEVLGFRTDAMYLTRDPRWADDGAAGRFRLKGLIPAPVNVPAAWKRDSLRTAAAWDALNRLRDRATDQLPN